LLNYKIEDVMDTLQEDLCEYCPLNDYVDELPPSPTPSNPMGCEGMYCEEATGNYSRQRKKKVRRIE
jgi:hypothetical protein